MQNETIIKFYAAVNKFIKTFSADVNRNFTEEKIYQVIRDIPKIIENFNDCSSEEEYRMLAKKGDGSLASIQIIDPGTGYKVYRSITSEEYKNLYYECLMYSLILYELYWKNYKYDIINDYNNSKQGELEFLDNALPHLLGIESKYIGNSALLEKIIPGYSGNEIIDQIMLIIFNHEKIKNYELENGIEIFNYYKSMQKVKEFLMLGRFFNNFDYAQDNKVLILDNENSDNQIWLVKKSNMNKTMNKNIMRILLQRNSDGKFFPRSMQSISDDIELEYLAAPYIRKGVEIDGLSDDEKLQLLNQGLLTYTPFIGLHLKNPVINPRINPSIFGTMFSAEVIDKQEFERALKKLGKHINLESISKDIKKY